MRDAIGHSPSNHQVANASKREVTHADTLPCPQVAWWTIGLIPPPCVNLLDSGRQVWETPEIALTKGTVDTSASWLVASGGL